MQNSVSKPPQPLKALSYRGMHLEKFPLARFAKMADSCLKTLEEIGG
ncbi:hypothetical protein PL9214640495 [Planktothrix tepida PCC 9214]|uniref:Uncharacterized protein n=1 Tax=Planktothrix tepida PCC 9214 TaxID=671072 RepID=A0A1J1LPJ2_9CYAN|nr:hypothetical protein PL9214640495 [Planktothrix tepida PCC 9214]